MKDLRVASVQFNHRANDKAYNMWVIEQFVEKAHRQSVDMIVFPEMCITGYWHVSRLDHAGLERLAEPVPEGRSTQRLLALSEKTNMNIGAG